MKKAYILVLIVFGILSFQVQIAQASFEEDYQNYLKVYDSYRLAASSYLTTRNQYLTYGTLTAKNDALTAVKNFLIARDDVLINYFGLLNGRNTDPIFSPVLANQMNEINDHRSLVPAIGSLDDAVDSSKKIEKQQVSMQVFAKKIAGAIMLAKVENMHTRSQMLQTDAATLVSELRNQGKDVTTIERWLLDAKNKDLLAEQKIIDTKTSLAGLNSYDLQNLVQSYNKIQFMIFEANQYVQETINYMKELSEAIKYGNY